MKFSSYVLEYIIITGPVRNSIYFCISIFFIWSPLLVPVVGGLASCVSVRFGVRCGEGAIWWGVENIDRCRRGVRYRQADGRI